jgi:hypothetical protein
VGEVWRIGIAVGFGVALGLVFTALLATRRAGLAAALVLAAVAGAGAGFAIDNWQEAIGGALGGPAGVLGSAQLVRGALQRGGTRAGTAILVALAALVLAVLALVPFVGYLEAIALPALGARVRRRGGERYAGLRILARD